MKNKHSFAVFKKKGQKNTSGFATPIIFILLVLCFKVRFVGFQPSKLAQIKKFSTITKTAQTLAVQGFGLFSLFPFYPYQISILRQQAFCFLCGFFGGGWLVFWFCSVGFLWRFQFVFFAFIFGLVVQFGFCFLVALLGL